MNKTINDIKLIDILPESLKYDPDIKAAAAAVDLGFLTLAGEVDNIIILPRVDEVSEDLLDHLAYFFHVDFYNIDLDIDIKKKLVKDSIYIHQIKGTPLAVETILSTLFDSGNVKEWFEYNGEPYYFRIHTKDILGSEQKYIDTIKALNTVKNTRSWLEKIIVERDLKNNIYHGLTNRQLRTNSYYPYSLEDTRIINQLNIGISSRIAKTSNYSINIIEDSKTNNKVFFAGICKRLKEIKMEVEHV